MKIAVWYNTTREGIGDQIHYMVTRTRVEDEDETYCLVSEVETADHDDVLDRVADRVWRAFNVVDGSEIPMLLGVRSMCMGDMIVIGGSALQVASVGFSPAPWFEEEVV